MSSSGCATDRASSRLAAACARSCFSRSVRWNAARQPSSQMLTSSPPSSPASACVGCLGYIREGGTAGYQGQSLEVTHDMKIHSEVVMCHVPCNTTISCT